MLKRFDTTTHAKFRRRWSGKIASLTHYSFCPFLLSSPLPYVASLDAFCCKQIALAYSWQLADLNVLANIFMLIIYNI